MWKNDGGCSSTTIIFIWLSVDYLEKIETQLGKRVSSEPCEYSCLISQHEYSAPQQQTPSIHKVLRHQLIWMGFTLGLEALLGQHWEEPRWGCPFFQVLSWGFCLPLCPCASLGLWSWASDEPMNLSGEPRKDITWYSPAVVSLCSFVGMQMSFCHTAVSLIISILSFFQPSLVNLFFLNCPNHSQNKKSSGCLN